MATRSIIGVWSRSTVTGAIACPSVPLNGEPSHEPTVTGRREASWARPDATGGLE